MKALLIIHKPDILRKIYRRFVSSALIFLVPAALLLLSQSNPFTMEDIKSYPFPSSLTSSSGAARIAWIFNENGLRNVFVAEGPEFKARSVIQPGWFSQVVA